jgi:hypothetical protein
MMVKLLKTWVCETCGKKYDSQKAAEKCESVVPKTYPIGCMYAHYRGHVNDTYAVCTNRITKHENKGGSWCSSDDYADELFVGHLNTCIDGSGRLVLGKYDKYADLSLPSCHRMIEWLESQGITPTIWDGKKAISLEEARKNPQSRWRYKDSNGVYPRRRRDEPYKEKENE